MNGGQLHQLGRRLITLARTATADGGDRATTPAEAVIIEVVLANPGGSVTDIAQRTGLAQSHVSVLVARLRERGIVLTTPDPADGRRARVQVSRRAQRAIANRAQRPVDDALVAAVGDVDAARRAAKLLDELADLLLPTDRPAPGG